MVSISDCIRTFGNMLGAPSSDSGVCGFQTFLKVFGGTASFAWVAVITYVMYNLLLRSDKWDKFKVDRYKLYFHAGCWSFAFINAIIPSAGGYYANTSAWCFIEQSQTGIYMIFYPLNFAKFIVIYITQIFLRDIIEVILLLFMGSDCMVYYCYYIYSNMEIYKKK